MGAPRAQASIGGRGNLQLLGLVGESRLQVCQGRSALLGIILKLQDLLFGGSEVQFQRMYLAFQFDLGRLSSFGGPP